MVRADLLSAVAPARTLIVALLFGAAASAAAQETLQAPRADGKTTPMRVYQPAPHPGCPPLAVLSPGAGSTELGLSYIAEGLRNAGWRAVVLGHRDSGSAALREQVRTHGTEVDGLAALVTDPDAYRSRLLDVGAALAFPHCRPPHRLFIGHSMGAATVMIEAGALNRFGIRGADRFNAYVALSPQGPGSIFPPHAWRKLAKPMLLATGTGDAALEGDWQWRTLPFEDMRPGCKWLAVIDGATHRNFAGIDLFGNVRRLTLATLGVFLDGTRTQRCPQLPAFAGMALRRK
jgi:predicted dienelactone hydrolase